MAACLAEIDHIYLYVRCNEQGKHLGLDHVHLHRIGVFAERSADFPESSPGHAEKLVFDAVVRATLEMRGYELPVVLVLSMEAEQAMAVLLGPLASIQRWTDLMYPAY